MPDNDYELYVGVDWATQTHQICVLGPGGERVDERSVPHTGAGLAALGCTCGSTSAIPPVSPWPLKCRMARWSMSCWPTAVMSSRSILSN
jgi:hypothetical protein